MDKTKIDELRAFLKVLQKERAHIIMEKGLSAEDNKDLRENSEYIYLEQQEDLYNAKIKNLIKEMESHKKKDLKVKRPKKPLEKVQPNFEKKKWL